MLVLSGNFSKRDLGKAVSHAMLLIPYKAGEVVVRFANQRFQEETWVDGRSEPWPRRQKIAKRNKGRRLLVDSGRLRRSIRMLHTTQNSVTIGSDVPYADAHNNGYKALVHVRPHARRRFAYEKETYTTRSGKERKRTVQTIAKTFQVGEHPRRMNMPRRKFLGESREQSAQIRRMILLEINRALK